MGWGWTSQWGPCGRSRDEMEDLGIFYRNKFQRGWGPRDFQVLLMPGRTSLLIELIWVIDLTSNIDYISWWNICSRGVKEPVSSVISVSLLLDGTYTNHQLIYWAFHSWMGVWHLLDPAYDYTAISILSYIRLISATCYICCFEKILSIFWVVFSYKSAVDSELGSALIILCQFW